MDVLAYLKYLKPENGPVGKVLNAWLDNEPSGRATRLLMFVFIAALTSFQVISNASVGPPSELLDTYAKALHPAAGYYGAAPLAPLIAAVWFLLAPAIDWAIYLLAAVNAGFALFAVDLVARREVAGDKRMLVLLFLLLTPFYCFYGQYFDSDRTLLWAWPVATLGFLRALETKGPARSEIAWSAFAGAAAGLALLGGYQTIFLLAGFAAGVLVHPGRWTYLRSHSPWISAAAGALVVAPHVYWLYRNGFAPLADVVAQHTGAPLAQVLSAAASYAGAGLAGVAVPVALYWLAVRPDRATLREAVWPSDPDGRVLVVVFTVPLLLRALLAPLAGTVLTPDGSAPAWFLLPILLLRPTAARTTRTATIRIAALIIVLAIAALVAAPWLASRYHKEGTAEGREYYRQVSFEVTRNWHASIGRLLRIVMGDPHLTAAIAFYSPDHPDAVPDFMLRQTPWVTEDRLDGEGWAAVCRAEDTACVDEARRRAADKTGTQFINFQTRNLYQGTAGNPGRFFFILVPAQPVVRVPR
jgi:4-amino-4-deoxy-L-arabinose transferase-like glycosyltransferase